MRRRITNYFKTEQKVPLVVECFRRIQFNEVDLFKIVWHGSYSHYLEEGRNEWGRKFGFGFHEMTENGFMMPIVQLHIDYLYPLHYDELIRIKTIGHWTTAAKMNISYEIYSEDGVLAAKGYTVQLYTDLKGNPLVLRPEFAEDFFERWDQFNLNTDVAISF